MNLTNTSRYAIRIMSFMAMQEHQLVSAKFLVEKLNISDKYLRSLMTLLAKRGLIRSIQGRDGGYALNKPVNELYLIEIIKAVENIDKYLGCVLGFSVCSDENPCALHNQWAPIKHETFRFMSETTLESIIMDKSIHKF
jgi:Rrf2 family protein